LNAVQYFDLTTSANRSSYGSYKTFVANDLAGSTLEAQGYGAYNPIISLRQLYEYDSEEDQLIVFDARDLTNTNSNTDVSTAIYRPDGVLLANSYSDLWDGSLLAPIFMGGFTGFTDPYMVWTGTRSDGTALNPLIAPVSDSTPSSTFRVGNMSVSYSEWINGGYDYRNHHYSSIFGSGYTSEYNAYKLYAISDTNEVPFVASSSSNNTSATPEPSTAIEMGLLGVLGFVGNRGRRRES